MEAFPSLYLGVLNLFIIHSRSNEIVENAVQKVGRYLLSTIQSGSKKAGGEETLQSKIKPSAKIKRNIESIKYQHDAKKLSTIILFSFGIFAHGIFISRMKYLVYPTKTYVSFST